MKNINKLKIFIYLFFFLLLIFYLTFKQKNYYTIPTYSKNNYLNAVIEIPAGTNMKIEYNPGINSFMPDVVNGQDRVIKFLPYPGNYGFIPSTFMDTKLGGDGDALDILVIAESVPVKTIMEVIPIAIIKLLDENEIDNKIIAIPVNSEERIINVKTFSEFEEKYPVAKNIIENWFSSYEKNGQIKFLGWEDENHAKEEIKKWMK
ncbi:MAG: inorganic diphosphatase [Bacteroidales bacterium]|nr:inorganic diphosphatase [Bacteroidales bacterium]